jgi:hypothetical protein
VKVLFIGEGRHDIGDSSPSPFDPRPAQGTVPTLARRVCRSIAPESVALAWNEIRRFNPDAQKRGFAAKVPAAVLVAERRLGCSGTVLVADRDGDANRGSDLAAAVERARRLFGQQAIAWGLAVESVEAWTLAARESIAEELGVAVAAVRQLYPRGVPIEAMSERSGKEDHRPKRLLECIAQLRHRSDSTEFR